MTTRERILLALALVTLLTGATSQLVASGTISVSVPSGRAASFTADQTSPTNATAFLAPSDVAPSACDVGDIAVVGTKLEVCTAANTWTIVGTQGCIGDGDACDGDPVCCNFAVCNTTCVCSGLGVACVTVADCCEADACVDIGSGPVCVQL